jgi:ribosome-binding protein aMBF1 (putative translation factor)
LKCETCGKEIKEPINEFVNCSYSPAIRLKVCDRCMQLLIDGDYKTLTKLGKKAGIIKE